MMAKEWKDYSGHFMEPDVPYDAPIKIWSYRRPANLFWNAIVNHLIERGMSEKESIEWVGSKDVRWMLDGFEERIEDLVIDMVDDYMELPS